MYRKMQVFDKQQHAGLKLRSLDSYALFASVPAVPLAPAEVSEASRHMPVVFSAGDSPHFLALLGVGGDTNLAVDDQGRWRLGYVPAWLRRYPFALAQTAEGQDKVLAFDSEAGNLDENQGAPLLDADGQPTETLQKILQLVHALDQSEQQAGASLAQLAEAQLLEDKELTTVNDQGEPRVLLSGFRILRGDRLAEQSDELLAGWVRNGFMPLLYAHQQSMNLLDDWLG